MTNGSNPRKWSQRRSKPTSFATKRQLVAINTRVDRLVERMRDLKDMLYMFLELSSDEIQEDE